MPRGPKAGRPLSDAIKAELGKACAILLRPLVRILLRHGIAFAEFGEIAKSVYVDVARRDFAVPGRKPSDSRVAILTGLTRKDVRRLREALEGSSRAKPSSANRATRVLSAWHQDADFCDPSGQPSSLPIEGKRRSFAALVRRYSGDMPPRAMLEELERVRAVRCTRDGRVRILTRSYLPGDDDPQGVRILGTAVGDLLATIDHNLDRDRKGPRRLQRSVSNVRVEKRSVPIFRRTAERHGQDFLEALDDWLSAHEAEEGEGVRVGVGIYLFQDEPVPEDEE
jgi:hypothetical protein